MQDGLARRLMTGSEMYIFDIRIEYVKVLNTWHDIFRALIEATAGICFIVIED